jgi:hypothetical protein
MSPAGFEHQVPANELPQTENLDRATAGIGYSSFKNLQQIKNRNGAWWM